MDYLLDIGVTHVLNTAESEVRYILSSVNTYSYCSSNFAKTIAVTLYFFVTILQVKKIECNNFFREKFKCC